MMSSLYTLTLLHHLQYATSRHLVCQLIPAHAGLIL